MRRLIGWRKIALKPGESRRIAVSADPRLLAAYDTARHDWHLAGGAYTVAVGGSSADLPLSARAEVADRRIKP